MKNPYALLTIACSILLAINSCKPSQDTLSYHASDSSKNTTTAIPIPLDAENLKRKVRSRDLEAIFKLKVNTGTFAAYICINRAGDVITAQVDHSNTTFSKPKYHRAFLKAVYLYKYVPDSSAPVKECGILSFTFNKPENLK